ncbi:hypothetical protein MNBD_IGNAVI01-328 [hydrothermal vent metagenome]|uniref:HNH nuclease domain-containing protein n=1 Tax=hydrothermal vent metagenome TaxID=652676 RepID=A0A3B1CRT7_9ZZZZ
MPFSEKTKLEVKEKADFRCCICHKLEVEIHHIIPQSEGGPDDIDNAAPLCPSCHETYGDNPKKRKFIRQARDAWYERVSKTIFPSIDLQSILQDYVKKEELEKVLEKQSKNTVIVDYSFLVRFLQKFKFFKISPIGLTEAKLSIQKNDYDTAKELLEKVNSECLYLLGYVNGEQNDLEAMLDSFDKSISINNQYEKEINDYKNYQWQEYFNKGVENFNSGVKETESNLSKKLFDESIENFKNSIICNPKSVESYQNLVYSLINAGREDELEEPLKKVIELNQSAEAYVDLSKVYNNQAVHLINYYTITKNESEKDEAMKIYETRIALLEEGRKIHSEDTAILAQLSNAYVEANKMDEAMETFKQGVEKDPMNEKYRYNYGVLLLGAYQYANAIEQFKKAIEVKNDYSSAYYNLGVTYLKWGAELQEKAIEEESDDMSYKEKFKEALPPLEKYLATNPEDAAIWDYVGKIYANLGDTEKSKEAFDKATSIECNE